jgi:hypothetical protein
MGLTAASIYDLKLLLQSHPTAQGSQILLRLDRKVRAIFVGPILCTNLLSTSLIAWKAWYVVWFLVLFSSSHDGYSPTPGIITELWARISERVDLLGAWRRFSCF